MLEKKIALSDTSVKFLLITEKSSMTFSCCWKAVTTRVPSIISFYIGSLVATNFRLLFKEMVGFLRNKAGYMKGYWRHHHYYEGQCHIYAEHKD